MKCAEKVQSNIKILLFFFFFFLKNCNEYEIREMNERRGEKEEEKQDQEYEC